MLTFRLFLRQILFPVKGVRKMAVSLQKLKKRTLPETDEKQPKKAGRFDGLTEEEVKKNTLKDILEPDLDIVFVGINPSLMAAHTGRYYAGPGNHFYKLLHESELIPEPINYKCDDALLLYKIGLTNMVARATRSSADLSRSEIKKGGMLVQERLKKFKPKIAVFNGKCIYEEFADKYNKNTFRFGLQPQKVGETALWVVPSSSARCANFPRMQDKLHFYTSLKKYLAFLNGEIEEVDLQEFVFEGRCKQAIPSTSKMWRRKTLSAFAHGGRVVNKETVCMDTSEENILAVPRSTEFILKNLNKVEDDDSEKDSGVSASQSSVSPECSQEQKTNGNAENEKEFDEIVDSKSKRKLPIKRAPENKIPLKSPTIIQRKERTENIDFVSLIKQRLNNKEKASHENEKEEESLPKSKTRTKGLKYENLQSNKSKRGFKVKATNEAENDE